MKTCITAVRRSIFLLCTITPSLAAFAVTPPASHWIGTWAAPPEAQPNTDDMLGRVSATYREIVHVSIGRSSVRVVLTNELGLEPLTISAGDIAISAGGSAIEPSTMRALHFDGQALVTLPASATMVSDSVDLNVPALSDLTISLLIPAQTISQVSAHSYALQTNYVVPGSLADARTFDAVTNITSWPLIREVEVESESAMGGSIVAW
jgi:hypothetical protein